MGRRGRRIRRRDLSARAKVRDRARVTSSLTPINPANEKLGGRAFHRQNLICYSLGIRRTVHTLCHKSPNYHPVNIRHILYDRNVAQFRHRASKCKHCEALTNAKLKHEHAARFQKAG